MGTHADKTKDNKNQLVATETSQVRSRSASAFQLEDKRPEAIQMAKLQGMANNSPKTKRSAQLQAMANNSSLQQMQTLQMKEKVNINDDEGLEKEADVMGTKALGTVSQLKNTTVTQLANGKNKKNSKGTKKGKGNKKKQKEENKARIKKNEEAKFKGAKKSMEAKEGSRDKGKMADKGKKKKAKKKRIKAENQVDRTFNNAAIVAIRQRVVAQRALVGVPATMNAGDDDANGTILGGTDNPLRLRRGNESTLEDVASSLQESKSGILARHYPHANGNTIIIHVH